MLFSGKRSPLTKLRLKKPTVFCLPGFHLDPVWRRTQAEFIEHSLTLARQYLLACRADPYYGVYLSEIDYLKPYLDLYPEDRAWITQLIQQERCATGGAYNQPNETSIGGEALIRNLLIGRLYHKIFTGDEAYVYMGWDAFGHVPQLPQILEQCGMRAAVFTRTDYRDPTVAVPGMPDLFLWYAPNGSSVYARRINYCLPPNCNWTEEAAQRLEAQKRRYPNLNADLLLDAGDMQSPRATMVGRCRELASGEFPIVVTGAAAAKYFCCVDTLIHSRKLALEPVTRDLTQYNEGCELTRMDLKAANHGVECRLLEAEIWATIVSAYGAPYPSRLLDKAWRQVLFCQHHDAITGCGTDIVFVDLLDAYREALEMTEEARRTALERLSGLISTQPKYGDATTLIFNCLPWRRDSLVRQVFSLDGEMDSFSLINSEGEEIPFEIEPTLLNPDGSIAKAKAIWLEKELPACGYRPAYLLKKDDGHLPMAIETQSRQWIENEFLRVEIDPARGGGIVGIYDKETGREYINTHHSQPANDVMALMEGAGDEPAWRLLTTGKKNCGSNSTAQIRVFESPVSTRLVIQGKGPGPCRRVQEIRLYREQPFIDCTTILDNYRGYGQQALETDAHQARDLYVVAFPLNLPGALPVLEDRFYAKAYRRSRGYMDFHSTLYSWNSQHAMNSCYRWVDVSWTFRVRFLLGKEEKASLAVGPSEVVIGQDKHRSLRERIILHLARHGVTCTPRYDRDDPTSDRLFRQCSFSIGTKEENAYTHRLLERNPEANEYFERNLREIGYVFLALDDETGESGHPRTPVFLFAGKTDALTSQAVDEMIQSTVAHRWDCTADSCFFRKRGVLEDAGFAILNRGTKLCSLEEDGTLALALMHTAPYPSPQTPWPFDFAEQKTHIFQYRLIPHSGDWRNAEIPRRAMEYNHESAALSVSAHGGALPASVSFWSVEPGNILLSALKPTGFPEPGQSPAIDGNSVTVRLYETHGEESNLWLESHREVKSVKPVRIDEQPLYGKREVFREDQFIRTIAHAHEIVTLNLEFKPSTVRMAGVSQKKAARTIIAPARYWRLNQGAAPEGGLPIAISLRGQIKTSSFYAEATVHAVDLVVVNNSAHEERRGEVEILTPSYWRPIPAKVSYRLQGGSYQIVPLHIVLDGPEREGFVKARTQADGITIEDLFHLGPEPEFDISMTLTHESFNIQVKHDYAYEVDGSVTLISPIEAWPNSLVDYACLTSISPRKQDFSIPPENEKTLVFPISEPHNAWELSIDHVWMIVKLAAHHCLRYYHVRLDGRPSEGLGRVLHPPYDLDVKK